MEPNKKSNKGTKNKNRDAQKKRSSHKVCIIKHCISCTTLANIWCEC